MRSLLRRIFRQPDAPQAPVARRRRVEIADGRPIYAIGDVHGCFEALLALEDRIAADARRLALTRPLVVYLGDYIDRGPDSRAVLNHLARSDHADRIERVALCGNHDDTFLRFLRSPGDNMGWLDFGGDATLRSYGIDPAAVLKRRAGDLGRILREAVPGHHVALLESLPVALACGDLLFVHAGIRPGVALEDQDDEDLLWIREPFLSEGPRLPLTVVHGHTAGSEPVFGRGRVCIDTGCYATGRLTAIRITPDGSALL
ncbi:metallophosphoesterase family protein [Shinella pollutisoli]|uniref:Metallophosphoesterase family protein n=1 Tax=Shinella pollutisoli TaxID=2250594 RepID=A0ABV7DD41_9HYPH|nr:metallophosphoesterase family protein [Shinella pollutisoli]